MSLLPGQNVKTPAWDPPQTIPALPSVSAHITAVMRADLKPHCVVNHVHLLQGRKEEARGGPTSSELNYVQSPQYSSFNSECGSCLGRGISC
ncbi:uncharacterized [Tachysurus ichikawai]